MKPSNFSYAIETFLYNFLFSRTLDAWTNGYRAMSAGFYTRDSLVQQIIYGLFRPRLAKMLAHASIICNLIDGRQTSKHSVEQHIF